MIRGLRLVPPKKLVCEFSWKFTLDRVFSKDVFQEYFVLIRRKGI